MKTQNLEKEDISCMGCYSGNGQLQLLDVPHQTGFNQDSIFPFLLKVINIMILGISRASVEALSAFCCFKTRCKLHSVALSSCCTGLSSYPSVPQEFLEPIRSVQPPLVLCLLFLLQDVLSGVFFIVHFQAQIILHTSQSTLLSQPLLSHVLTVWFS